MTHIATLTLNPAIDGASETEKVRPTHKMRTSNESYEPGGGGINVARVIGELGGPAVAVYLSGGVTGPILDALVKERSIASRRIPITGHTRISHTVFEQASGCEFRFVPEGPKIAASEWQASLAALDEMEFDYLVASGSLPRGVPDDFYCRVAEIARRKQARLVLDTSGEALRQAVAAGGIYLVKPSLGEFQALVGRKVESAEEQDAAALDFVQSGKVELIAVTLGHRGAILAHQGGIFRLDAIKTEARSAVGAGDSFVAGMTFALTRGRDPIDAFKLGVAAGTAAVVSPGTELAKRTDIERFYTQLNGGA